MIDLAFRNSTKNHRYGRVFFKKILQKAVKTANLKILKIELSINLVGNGKITKLNKKYRNKNVPTDVLSFPLQKIHPVKSAKDSVKYFGRIKTGAKTNISGIISLGDIFISLPMAEKYAKEEGVSFSSKLEFLTVHGLLHLLGFQHDNKENSKKMFSLQERIFNASTNNLRN